MSRYEGKHHAHDLRKPGNKYFMERRTICGLRLPSSRLHHLHQRRKLVTCKKCLGMLEHGGKGWILQRRDDPPMPPA